MWRDEQGDGLLACVLPAHTDESCRSWCRAGGSGRTPGKPEPSWWRAEAEQLVAKGGLEKTCRQQKKLQKAAAFSCVGAASILLRLEQQRCWGRGWVLRWANCCRRIGQLAASKRDLSLHGDSLLMRATETHQPPGTSRYLRVCLPQSRREAWLMNLRTKGEMSCLLRATLQSLYLQLTPHTGINSAAQQIWGYHIHILQLKTLSGPCMRPWRAAVPIPRRYLGREGVSASLHAWLQRARSRGGRSWSPSLLPSTSSRSWVPGSYPAQLGKG